MDGLKKSSTAFHDKIRSDLFIGHLFLKEIKNFFAPSCFFIFSRIFLWSFSKNHECSVFTFYDALINFPWYLYFRLGWQTWRDEERTYLLIKRINFMTKSCIPMSKKKCVVTMILAIVNNNLECFELCVNNKRNLTCRYATTILPISFHTLNFNF